MLSCLSISIVCFHLLVLFLLLISMYAFEVVRYYLISFWMSYLLCLYYVDQINESNINTIVIAFFFYVLLSYFTCCEAFF